MEYRVKFFDGVCSDWSKDRAATEESVKWWNETTFHQCEMESREVVEEQSSTTFKQMFARDRPGGQNKCSTGRACTDFNTKKSLDNSSSLCYDMTIKEVINMTYTFLNLLTSEIFSVSASTPQEAFSIAFAVCPFSKLLTEI